MLEHVAYRIITVAGHKIMQAQTKLAGNEQTQGVPGAGIIYRNYYPEIGLPVRFELHPGSEPACV
jgi:hypothetical protein